MFGLKVESGHQASHPAAVHGDKEAVGYDDFGLLTKGKFEGVPCELSPTFQVSDNTHIVDEIIDFGIRPDWSAASSAVLLNRP